MSERRSHYSDNEYEPHKQNLHSYRHNHLDMLRQELRDLLRGNSGVSGPLVECVNISEIRYRLARAWSRSHMPIIRSRNSK